MKNDLITVKCQNPDLQNPKMLKSGLVIVWSLDTTNLDAFLCYSLLVYADFLLFRRPDFEHRMSSGIWKTTRCLKSGPVWISALRCYRIWYKFCDNPVTVNPHQIWYSPPSIFATSTTEWQKRNPQKSQRSSCSRVADSGPGG